MSMQAFRTHVFPLVRPLAFRWGAVLLVQLLAWGVLWGAQYVLQPGWQKSETQAQAAQAQWDEAQAEQDDLTTHRGRFEQLKAAGILLALALPAGALARPGGEAALALPLLPALAAAAMIPCEFPVFSRSIRREAAFALLLLMAILLSGELPGVPPLPSLDKIRRRWEHRFDLKWNGPPPLSHSDLSWSPDPPGLAPALEESDPRLRLIAEDCSIFIEDIGARNMVMAILAKSQAFLDGTLAGFEKAGSAIRLQPALSPAFLNNGRLSGDVDGVLMLELDGRFHRSKFEWPSERALGPDWTELQSWRLSDSHSARFFIRTRRLQ